MFLRVCSVTDCPGQVDPVAHVGDASKRVDQSSVRTAHCSPVRITENKKFTTFMFFVFFIIRLPLELLPLSRLLER